ncbi:PPK2 family polyphosphate:nucleotide phosphotransferase [Salana multivorans]|uniref:PPK2 family polyphosphate:nucleotide phosphotransferase n=1 Tax=Salana multivorans TaxID=120377 RepID=A0A3N2D7R9_9MICO|nr:PPK2 family polyphosphate kinase [Salana multivorans]ROR95827.1 PPK2 family polyphosphate:nucleotide phosphotransferase [Salana multivorans]
MAKNKASKKSGTGKKSHEPGAGGKATKADRGEKAKKPKKSKKSGKAATSRGAATGDDSLAPVPVTTAGSEDWTTPPREALAVGDGFRIADLDAAATPGWTGSRAEAEARLAALGEELSELQERLFAEGRSGGRRAVLLVLQGLDTAGKGGIVRHVVGMVDPQGVSIRSFGVPTPEERSHHYLWRIDRSLPAGGRIGVFDRSQYEDVLVVRVDSLAPLEEIEGRYEEINEFERALVERETSIVKVALVVSPHEQYRRLRERLERPDKYWKFSLGDLAVRAKRPAYDEAYQLVLDRTNTSWAPWYVIPADNKWFARLAVAELVVQALRDLDLSWPPADFDVAEATAALDAQQDEPV